MLTLVAYNGSCVSSCYGTVYKYSGKGKSQMYVIESFTVS